MTGERVRPADAVVGRRYRVEFDDCCVSGVMTGALVREATTDDGGMWVVSLDCGGVTGYNVTMREVGS